MHRTTLRALAIATLLTFAGAGIALAGTTTTYTTVSYSGDSFYNWDNTSTSCACGNNVDWPATMVFRTNADIRKVKTIIGGFSGTPNVSQSERWSGLVLGQ